MFGRIRNQICIDQHFVLLRELICDVNRRQPDLPNRINRLEFYKETGMGKRRTIVYSKPIREGRPDQLN
jgi:hypothetical protein